MNITIEKKREARVKFGGGCAVLIAAMLSLPLKAAVIVQEQLEESPRPLALFNPAFGTLNSVNIRYSVFDFPVNIDVLSNSAEPVIISYDLSVPFFASYEVTNGTRRFGQTLFNVMAAGNQKVDLQPQNTSGFTHFGSVRLLTSGFTEASLDPDIFIDRGDPNSQLPFGNFFNIGFGSFLGAVNTSRNDVLAFAFPGTQSSVGIGQVRLTYDFTSFASAVPEPSTWAMMLVGFGGIGYAMRRKQRTRVAFAEASSPEA